MPVRVAVFAGSAAGPTAHLDAAADFARRLAEAGVGIVYGGGRVGVMGVVADAALAADGEVVGVMPQHLVDREIAHRGLTRLDVVADMHARKARMTELADAFIALPGGPGTLDETFEAWTWGQLGLHDKPVACSTSTASTGRWWISSASWPRTAISDGRSWMPWASWPTPSSSCASSRTTRIHHASGSRLLMRSSRRPVCCGGVRSSYR